MSDKIWISIDSGKAGAGGVLAGEALRKAADASQQAIEIEIRNADHVITAFASNPGSGDIVLLISDDAAAVSRFPEAKVKHMTLEDVLSNPEAVLAAAMRTSDIPTISGKKHKIVAITSCPTGIAHTFMAAEGLQQSAKALGHDIRVETQGSVGAQDELTSTEIAAADIIIIAADREVDRARFSGKRVFSSGTKPAITNGQNLIKQALLEATVQSGGAQVSGSSESAEKNVGPYRHLMTGVSFMLPFVVAGGLMIALAFAFGGIYAGNDENAGTLAYALSQIGGKGGFALMVPALAGYIAFSIADRPGIAPGMIGGMVAANIGSGFLGGIVAGFLAGYTVWALNKWIKLPKNLAGLKPVLILPFFGTLIVGLIMVYIIGEPVAKLLSFLTEWLKGMQGSSSFVLGCLIGGMMALDMGGPVNKAAYAFSVALISSEIYTPMAAAMAAGMTPPLAVALATFLFKNRFTTDEREAGAATAVLGLAFISEGAIPFAARDPLRVIPSLMAGSAVTGAISMLFNCELRAPHGGIFVLLIPGAVSNLLAYVAAIIVGTIVSAILLGALKKPVATIAIA